jgi:deoxycytidylate deaminase
VSQLPMLSHIPSRPDIYVGLVAAAGTDLTAVRAQLKAQLAIVGYTVQEIKVSSLIRQLIALPELNDEYERIKALQRAGDRVREISPNGDGVAATVIAEIRRLRTMACDETSTSTAYVIDSFKNPAEVELFDLVYGRNYYTVSIYLERRRRCENLQLLIARSRHEPPEEGHNKQAAKLIELDEKSSGRKAQNVRDTFSAADFFVDAAESALPQIERFISLVFGKPFVSPTADEYGMFVARATGLRSADLSRQVGAAILDKKCRIVTTGCNEVPYPGGGIYSFPSRTFGDNRDHTHKVDPNFIEIQRSLIELIAVFQNAGLLDKGATASELTDSLLVGEYKELMANARIRNLIEFGRVVHAEMHAICEAAECGRPTAGATLYCTTFPCHGCARHIIAAGLSEVIYIEPYPKSLAIQLYGNEIALHSQNSEAAEPSPSKVVFRPFHGISPKLYQRVFNHRIGKDERGTTPEWRPLEAIPVGAVHSVERPSLELAASNSIARLVEQIREKKFDEGETSNGR